MNDQTLEKAWIPTYLKISPDVIFIIQESQTSQNKGITHKKNKQRLTLQGKREFSLQHRKTRGNEIDINVKSNRQSYSDRTELLPKQKSTFSVFRVSDKSKSGLR